jgi:hypothetical protein
MANTLTKERKGEIALMWLKEKLMCDGITVSKGMKRDVTNKANNLGIDPNEAWLLVEEIAREITDDVFSSNKKHK